MAPRSFRFPAAKWETICESPDAETYAAEIILVHDLLKKADLRDQLERTVTAASREASKSVGLSFRISVYRFNYKKIREKGEFETAFDELLGHVQKLLGDNWPRSRRASQTQVERSRQPPQRSPKILFITNELGAWLVRDFFSCEAPDAERDSENPLRRLAGIIFLGADERADFDYSTYLEHRLPGSSNEPNMAQHRSFLPQILRFVDDNFAKSLIKKSTGLADTTWILPPLGLSPPVLESSPLRRSESRVSISRMRKNLKNQRRPKSRDAKWDAKWPTSLTPMVPSEGPRPDNGGIMEFSRRVLQDLIVACDDLITSEQSNNPQDEHQYRYTKKKKLGVSTGMEDSMNVTAHPSPSNLSPNHLEDLQEYRYTSNESGILGFQGGYDEVLAGSIPGSPLLGNQERVSQPSLQGPHETVPTDLVDPMPERYRLGEMDTNQSTVDQILIEVEEKRLSAQSHLKMSDFDNAARLYERCLKILKKTKPQQDPHRGFSLSISIQIALLKFQKGEYMNAKDDLEELRRNIGKDDGSIPYYLAVVLTRLGDHHKAFKELEDLRQTTWFKQMAMDLDSRGTVPQSLFADARVEIVLGTSRLTALLWGYYGHYQEAKGMITTAKSQCTQFLEARRRSRDPQTLGVVSHEQGYSTISTKEVARPRQGQLPLGTKPLKPKIDLARAKLLMLQGGDESALIVTRRTLRLLEKQLGRRHILTLEAAALNALILSRRFDAEAESVCSTAINAMSEILGREHPLTREVLSTLVSIFLGQSRPYEALDTVATLFEQAATDLGKENPQTLRYLCQLGEVDLYVGNYQKAAQELKDVYEIASRKWMDQGRLGQYPDVLKYLTKSAVANSCLGKFTTARQLAKDALIKQAKIFKEKVDEGDELEEELVNSIFDKLDLKREAGFEITPHPDILDSLASYATILNMSGSPGPEVFETFQLLYELRKNSYRAPHYLTLQSGLDFGFACLGTSDQLGDPAKFFRRISSDCEQHLGSNHIFTWRAKLGDLLTSGLEYETAKFKSESSRIMRGQIAHLGQSHPIVLDSLSRIFVIELMVNDSAAHTTADLLLTQVRQPKIREQRLMETLQLEERVAKMYCAIGYYEQGLPIFDKMLKFQEAAGKYDKERDLTEELKSFWGKLQEVYTQARKSAENLRNEKLSDGAKALDDGRSHEAESLKRRAALLSRSLYPESDPKTVEAVESLAEALHDSVDPQKRVEGLTVLGDLLASIRKARLKSQGVDGIDEIYKRITDKHTAWQHNLDQNAGQDWQSDVPDMEQEEADYNVDYTSGEGKGKGREEEEELR